MRVRQTITVIETIPWHRGHIQLLTLTCTHHITSIQRKRIGQHITCPTCSKSTDIFELASIANK